MANRPDLNPPPSHRRIATELIADLERHDGLASVDLERFWHDQDLAHRDPFSAEATQCDLGVLMSGECVWDELGLPADYRRYADDSDFRRSLNIAYNDRAEKIVGRRLLSEVLDDPALRYPATRELHDVFEGRQEWHDWSWWLQQAADSEEQLAALLDRVERRLERLRDFVLPPNWAQEKARLMARGVKPPLYRWQRGPCTFATSIYGIENTLLLSLDNPDLAGRFRDLILRAMLGIARVLDEEAGYAPGQAPRGFGFADDNCCLFNADLYEFFGLPILRAVWNAHAPGLHDWRYQHSDSPMGHLLPLLVPLRLTGTNFGPTVTVADIRFHLPQAVIEGQLAPYTLSNNEHERIILEFLRDFDQARERRGLRFAAAGSINNGSRLTSMRLIMAAIQRFGRY